MEDAACRQWAETQSGWRANDTVNENLASGAAIGTLVGTGMGALIGSASGRVGSGAAIGAASGLILGTAGASEPARAAGYEVQRRYDIAYQQCMYSKGNQVPEVVYESRRVYRVLPALPPYPPPPPY
jgi:outer membrane lipoprotein SlyB